MLSNYNHIYFAIVVLAVSALLYGVNWFLSLKQNQVDDKLALFECGLSSFSQTRESYHVAFILIAILFLLFDLEISSLLLYSLVVYLTQGYGLAIVVIFTAILVVGFIYEYRTNALAIEKTHIKRLQKVSLYNAIRYDTLRKVKNIINNELYYGFYGRK